MNRDDIPKPDPQVLSYNLVDSDSSFLHCIVNKNDAHGVLTLLALHKQFGQGDGAGEQGPGLEEQQLGLQGGITHLQQDCISPE